jgi:hypothetical protein
MQSVQYMILMLIMALSPVLAMVMLLLIGHYTM